MDTYFIILALTVSSIIVLAYIYVFFRDRDFAIGLWSLAGVLLVGEFVLDISYNLIAKKAMPPPVQFMDWVSVILSSFLILWGIYYFLRKPLPRLWLFSYLIAIALVAVKITHYDTYMIRAILYLFQGVGLIWGGIELLRNKNITGGWKSITGITLTIWGLVIVTQIKFSSQSQPTFESPLSYLLMALTAGLAVIGFLLTYFQKKSERYNTQHADFQYISHQLKIHAMVIQNCAQSIQEGVFPGGSLEQSIKVINQEAYQLTNRLRNTLCLSKLDVLLSHTNENDFVNLTELIRDGVERFRWRRPELSWEMELIPLIIKGKRDQWTVVMDNLLDNQIRYAAKCINLRLQAVDEKDAVVLRI